MNVVKCNIEMIRYCGGCGLKHLLRIRIPPKEIKCGAADLIYPLKSGLESLTNYACPDCAANKGDEGKVLPFRSIDGSGSEWGIL